MKSKRQRFKQWARSRPASVRWMIRTLKPWHRYRVKVTGQQARLRSYCEDGTVTVVVANKFLGWMMPMAVFGLKPRDLERDSTPRAVCATCNGEGNVGYGGCQDCGGTGHG